MPLPRSTMHLCGLLQHTTLEAVADKPAADTPWPAPLPPFYQTGPFTHTHTHHRTIHTQLPVNHWETNVPAACSHNSEVSHGGRDQVHFQYTMGEVGMSARRSKNLHDKTGTLIHQWRLCYRNLRTPVEMILPEP